MSAVKVYVISLFQLLVVGHMVGQNWTNPILISDESNEVIEKITLARQNNLAVAITYNGGFEFDNSVFQQAGSDDLACVVIDSDNGTLLAKREFGSSLRDVFGGLEVDSSDIHFCGTLRGDFPDTLYTPFLEIPEYAFVAQMDEALAIQNYIALSSSDQVDVTAFAKWEEHYFLAGEFSDSLAVGDTVLVSDGPRSWFTVQLSLNGDYEYGWLGAYNGAITIADLVPIGAGQVYIGGSFDENITIDTPLVSATFDFDLFLAGLEPEGIAWSRRIAGVQDGIAHSMALLNDTLILAGSYLGVLRPETGLEITTIGFNTNLFVLGFSPNGNPYYARQLGGLGNETLTDLQIVDGELLLSGYLNQASEIGGEAIGSDGAFTAFTGRFSADLKLQWLSGVHSSSFITSNSIAFDALSSRLWMSGIYSGDFDFAENKGLNDSYILENSLISHTEDVSHFNKNELSLIYPNPATQCLYIKDAFWDSHEIAVDYLGRYWRLRSENACLNVQHLPKGMYELPRLRQRFLKL